MVTAEIDSTDDTKVSIVSEFKHSEMVKSLPGSRWDKDDRVWRIPLSWPGCLALRGVFNDELQIGPRLAAWATEYRATYVDPALELRDKLEADLYPDLYPFQNADVLFLTTAKQAILGSEPGVGKSASAIRSMLRLSESGINPFPALVVTPTTVKMAWKREFERWWPGVQATVIKGSITQRRKQLADFGHVAIVNWDQLRTHSRIAPYGSHALRRCKECGGEEDIPESRCQVHERELNKIPWKTVVADECHRAKDTDAQTTRALWAASNNAEFRWGLTGTPIANSPGDLWPILHWLDERGYPTKTKFNSRFLDIMNDGYGGMLVLGLKAQTQQEFFGAFDARFRRMTKKVVLPFLPEIVPQTRWVEMNPKQAKAYKQMKDKMLAELDSGELLVATSPLVRTGRLLQLASSYGELSDPYIWINPETGEEKAKQDLILTEPSSKISAFLDDLPDYGDQSLVVFAVSRQLINLLSDKLNKLGVAHGLITGAQNENERQESMDQFQAGATKLILCTIGAGGTGITLTAASTMVFLQRSWSQVEMIQAINRCHRIGSEIHASITRVDYVTPDSAEMGVFESLNDKAVQFEQVVRDRDLMRKLLTSGSIT